MAYYDVKHCCGHTESVQLYGPTKNREWRIHQMEQELCSECWAAELERRNAENAKKATQTTFDLENVLQKTLSVYKSIAPDTKDV